MKAKNRKHWTRGRALAREGVQNAMGGGFWSLPVACAMCGGRRKCSAPSQNFSLLAAIPFLAAHGASRRCRCTGIGAREAKEAAPTGLRPTDKKTMLPKRGTSSFVVVFLTRGKVGEAYQGERTSPSSAEGSSPQMGLTNFSDIPPPEKPGTAGSLLPGISSSKLSLSRHSCISSLTVVRLGLIYCNFIMCSVYLAMNFFPLVTYTPPLVVCCTRRPLKS